MMDFLRNIIMQTLIFFYGITRDYGLTIIMLTIALRIVTLPLSLQQIRSTRAMQRIAPEKAKLEEKYKGDKEKLNAATLELYKKHKVNPFAGCLPLLIQFPVLIAMFGVLRNPEAIRVAIDGFNPTFLGWINLELQPKLVLDPLNISLASIPILAAVTTYFQTKQTAMDQPGSNSMSSMAIYMPLMILVFGFTIPVGLSLYWLVGNIISIGQHFVVAHLFPAKEKEAQSS
jgi:YidC/Oxa1 family membrane protein insertase